MGDQERRELERELAEHDGAYPGRPGWDAYRATVERLARYGCAACGATLAAIPATLWGPRLAPEGATVRTGRLLCGTCSAAEMVAPLAREGGSAWLVSVRGEQKQETRLEACARANCAGHTYTWPQGANRATTPDALAPCPGYVERTVWVGVPCERCGATGDHLETAHGARVPTRECSISIGLRSAYGRQRSVSATLADGTRIYAISRGHERRQGDFCHTYAKRTKRASAPCWACGRRTTRTKTRWLSPTVDRVYATLPECTGCRYTGQRVAADGCTYESTPELRAAVERARAASVPT